jgi:hypothetical protein
MKKGLCVVAISTFPALSALREAPDKLLVHGQAKPRPIGHDEPPFAQQVSCVLGHPLVHTGIASTREIFMRGCLLFVLRS